MSPKRIAGSATVALLNHAPVADPENFKRTAA
jgi:hypothetical protein